MLTVTEVASARLAQMLEDQGVSEEVAVRFVIEGQGVALRQDTERPGDATFQHDGRTILLLDAEVSELLTETTLDLEDARLTLLHSGEGA